MFKVEKKGKSQMKSRNKIKVFRLILRDGPISRTDIEKKLKLSAPSVTRIVESLRKENLVREIGKEETYVGRKPIHLIANKNARFIIGIHIAKSNLKLCITNLGSEIIYKESRSITHIDEESQFLDELDNMISFSIKQSKIDQEKLLGIGIASRGALDFKSGQIFNIKKGIKQVPIISYLKERYSCEIIMEYSINTELINEYIAMDPSNARKKNLLYIYFGEGVGGSIICNGHVVRGKSNLAAKIGHMLVEPDGDECYCGRKGHLEAYCSKSAIEKAFRDKSGDGKNVDVRAISQLANNNDSVGIEVIHNVLIKLANAINNLLVIINPDIIVLSGEIFDYYEEALSILKDHVGNLVFDPKLNDIEWIVRSKEKVMIDYSATALVMNKVFNV
ncbi:ROK family transcriptional regulator [Vallitalea okinawensis]|uniref:ROK family transcriptional regulator n=1 Tax=Vallitalea okinawensis TaxID=2078660 RepID=UPI000CFCBA3E|nr:ROK family transcriptional regulator [Vallitalea okinawensis]